MTVDLPLFPLHVVLFPGRPLPLHVFEPRYRRLLDDSLAAGRRFGVVAIRHGREAGGQAQVFNVGTVAEIIRVERLNDGRANIVTRGAERFRIQELLHDRPYLHARAELLEDQEDTAGLDYLTAILHQMLRTYLCDMGAGARLNGKLPTSPAALTWLAACAVEVQLPEQQRLLELDSLAERLLTTIRLLRREQCLIRQIGQATAMRPQGPAGSALN